MQLSNKILLGFFGFLFIYLTAAFTELRLTGTPNTFDDKNSVAETVDLSGITYLILNDVGQQVHVTGSDSARLEVRSFTGDMLTRLNYKVSGDTLTLSAFQSEDIKRIKISVFVPKSLKGISVNNAAAVIQGLQQDHLHISENKGRIWMYSSNIGRIHTGLSNRSFLDINETSIDTLSVEIEESEVHCSSPVGVLRGSLKNKAFLQLNNIKEVQLKKDENSRLNMFQ